MPKVMRYAPPLRDSDYMLAMSQPLTCQRVSASESGIVSALSRYVSLGSDMWGWA